MAIQKTEAIVLKRHKFRETSLIALFYTRDFGKLKGIIKGIRNFKAKFNSSLEPFSNNEIVFYEKKRGDLHIISQCDLKDIFNPIRRDLKRIAYANYSLELLDAITPLQDRNEDIFELMLNFLKSISRQDNVEDKVHIFEIKLLGLSGFKPRLDSCVCCENQIHSGARFSLKLGGLLCERCFPQDRHAKSILKGSIASILHIERLNLDKIGQLKFIPKISKELSEILRDFLEFNLERRFKSLEFLNKLKLINSK